ncbi:MAG TPA: dihydrodipicolinate reductase C-terminal domain-containing protein [Gemmatimonadaceae bacterium]|nr:dihydrodipicolinate reductase C-terminal domain-containing protein [Gemmatimonadaceae bacterium]
MNTIGPRLALIGLGRMGRETAALAAERGWSVAATIGSRENREGQGITRDTLAGADVAIEFTRPESAPANVIACAAAGVPVVVGTTGWNDRLADVSALVEREGGAMLFAPNFSLGAAILHELVSRAAGLLAAAPGFDVQLVEVHHAAKRDAPSGTALALRDAAAALGRELPITSIRVGHVPGTHTLLADAPYEQLRLEHIARDRRVFAEGALAAAAWLAGRRGIYQLRDLFTTPEDAR